MVGVKRQRIDRMDIIGMTFFRSVFRNRQSCKFLASAFFVGVSIVSAEPIVLNGEMLPDLIGSRISSLRVVNRDNRSIPFQVDEITKKGEYVCPQGKVPNTDAGNGILDPQDEIVFLFEDADTGSTTASGNNRTPERTPVKITRGGEKRFVTVTRNPGITPSAVNYLQYDNEKQLLKTPYYYAQFGKDRFHFIRAGCMDFSTGTYVDLTNELRVEILLKALWGLLPIHYTENNIVCKVKRYKAGPVRLIRRGDFHLELGLGLKGSEAVVYQLCYPQVVKVPVRAHLPVRFSLFFKEAFIEMTPVMRKDAKEFRFVLPTGFKGDLSGQKPIDTLVRVVPRNGFLVTDGVKGFEWIVGVNVHDTLVRESGYILRRPSSRNSMAECGFRLTVRDLPKGSYDIVNWVFFSKHSLGASGEGLSMINTPAAIAVDSRLYPNRLVVAAVRNSAK